MNLFINKLRENINLFLYPSKERNLRLLRSATFWVAVINLLVLTYYYGFEVSPTHKKYIFLLLQFTLAFFIFRFFLRYLYDFHPQEFFKRNWIELLLVLFLVVEAISYHFYNTLLFEKYFLSYLNVDYTSFLIGFFQIIIIIFLLTQTIQRSDLKAWFKVHPALLFIASIAFMIVAGTLLLMLPKMNTDGHMSFIDALFTATSAVSTTGLSTFDISSELTTRGQIILVFLIQLGGLNTIAFGALLIIAYKFGVKVKFHEVVEDFINKENVLATDSMLGKIVKWVLVIELIGAIGLYFSFGNQGVFHDRGYRLLSALFHAVSAFNNAGMSIFKNGMMNENVWHNPFVHIIILILFILGGIGMLALFDLLDFQNIRLRMKYKWKQWEFSTKISIYFTFVFLLTGAVIFAIFEWNNTLKNISFPEKILFSLYESMTNRNAGFNVVDTDQLQLSVLLVFCFLMFVGASSGSTGGGIRTSTFAILWASVTSIVKNKKHVELFNRTIPQDLVLKAYAVFVFFLLLNMMGVLALSITEQTNIAQGNFSFIDILFEHISAASTVGLSTGITAQLTNAGKLILCLAMFIGRVGTLTVAYLVSKESISTNYKYPMGHTMVG